MAKYQCPTCGSDEYLFNGIDGYICNECSSQFFVTKVVPADGLCDNEIYDPETEEVVSCPECGATFFEDYDGFETTCFCGHVF